MQHGSTVLRQIEAGELVDGLEDPKADAVPGRNRVRLRNLTNGAEGWLTQTKESVALWAPKYKAKPTADCINLYEGLDTSSSDVVRSLEKGEMLRALMTPERERAGSIVIRLHVVAESDGTIGFVTVVNDEEVVFLEPVP